LTSVSEQGCVEFRVLGPVELHANGGPVEVGTPRQRAVLAALVVDAGRPVPLDTLIDRVWGQAPPDGVRRALYVYIARLRGLIRAAGSSGADAPRLVRRSGGYLLDVDPGLVDLHRFRTLVDQARDPDCADSQRAAMLRRALDLWRGVPLSGVTGDWVQRVRAGWQQQRLEAVTSWSQVELRLGNPGAVIDLLVDVTTEHPLVEPLAAALMRALYASGRSAEALDRYATIRQRLAEELGVDASPDLQRLHQAILRGEPDPWPGATPRIVPSPREPAQVAPAPPPATVPAQLPLDVYGFTGRSGELGQLDAILAAARDQPTAMAISVLSGMAGVGKTALAVHWAHQVAHRFPDGQLYLNLRGFDPDASATGTAEAVRGFLDAFGVPPQRVPVTVEAQVALYRSLLAGRRVLVILDNARDADQVRPLLPGAQGCFVVVTSRDQLSGLVAAQGAHPLSLGLPPAAEARNLIARRIGSSRTAAEERAVDEIIVHCGQLPLALAIVAARAASDPTLPLAGLAKELMAARGLDAFDSADAATDVRTVFSWSYRRLSPAAARLFRLLGLHPGPDVSAAATASLLGAPVEQVRPYLSELARANLVTEQLGDRFSSHDLLRAYALELTHEYESEVERRAARYRLLDHYLHSARAATSRIYPLPGRAELIPAQPGVTPEYPDDRERAVAWVMAERPVLVAAIDQSAGGLGFESYSWRLATAVSAFLDRRGHWAEWLETQHTALAAALRVADLDGQAQAHRGLGRVNFRLRRTDDALTHFTAALDLYRRLGDDLGQAGAHRGLASLHDQQGRFREALDHSQQALDGYRAVGDETGQANQLNAVGWFQCELGDHQQALASCEQALALLEAIDDRHGQAATWDSLGYVHHRLGDHPRAIACYERSRQLHHELGDRYQETVVLTHLGDTHHTAGDSDAATHAWRRALDVLEQLGHPDAGPVSARLESGQPPA
jgi:DNA-binding SARP family transcriptional activator/tetratricopeptide (TPR) repeat protein